MEKSDDKIVFYVHDKLKQSRLGEIGFRMVIYKFPEDVRTCVYSALEAYLSFTSKIRKQKQLFLSYVKPHGAVSRETISN